MTTSHKNIAYIDGANLHNGVSELNWELDYARFRVWLTEKYAAGTAKIFIGKIPEYGGIYANLQKAGFTILFKKVLRAKDGKVKGNCDAELVVEAMSDHYEKRSERSVIVSSDGDFAVLAKFLKEKGALASIISPRDSCSFLLRQLDVPILFMGTQRRHLEFISGQKEKAPGEDGTSQGPSS